MKAKCIRLPVLFALLVVPALARGYDKSVHHALIQGLVKDAEQKAGLKDAGEAALISNASQSVDDQPSTTAFDLKMLHQELQDWKAGNVAIEDVNSVLSGQMFHSLTAMENRPLMEQLHIDRMRQIRESPDYQRGTPERKQQLRNLELVYFGEYLHFVADAVVHPENPLLGHLGGGEGAIPVVQGDRPDRAQNNPDKLRLTIHIVSEKIEQFQAPGGPANLRPTSVKELTAPAPKLEGVKEELAAALQKAWLPTTEQNIRKAVHDHNIDSIDVAHVYEKVIDAKGADAVRQVLAKHGMEFEKQQVIRLDASGDPADTPENLKRFGQVRSIERLPLKTLAAQVPALKKEREKALAGAAKLTFKAAGRAVWKLPISPGGIALNPGLELPNSLGDVERITLDERGIAFVTAQGTLPVKGLDPQTFATILKTVAAGQVPFITIGTDPSDRTGYARVSVTPALRGTWEAEMLYRADVQFKAIFGYYPLGEDYRLNRPDDPLVGGYPGPGGEAGRFWITSSGIRLKKEGDVLSVERHGMRILGETRLLGQVVADPELEAYTAKLTANWDKIAEEVWEFQAVQDMALATALAFWVSQHRIPVDELIWTIPPRFRPEVDYSPAVAVVGRGQAGISGGVCLTPEDKSKAAGRHLLFVVARVMNEQEGTAGPTRVRLGFALVAILLLLMPAVFLPALGLWLIGRRCLRGTGRRAGFVRCLRTMLLACLCQGLLTALVAPLVFGDWLGWFDRLFLAFLATFVVAPPLLFFWVRRAGPALGDLHAQWPRAPVGRFALSILGITIPVWTALLGMAFAILTVAAVGPIPEPTMERALALLLAPGNVLGETAPLSMKNPKKPTQEALLPVPKTVLPAWGPMFEYIANPLQGDQDADHVHPHGPRDPNLPIGDLRRVNWPPEVPVDKKLKHFTPDGKPPH